MKKRNLIFLALLAVGAVAALSCSDAQEKNTVGNTEAVQGMVSADTEAVTEEPDPFADFDFGGEEIRIYTSINEVTGVGNSNYLIEGPEEETGDAVQDSAYERNRSVEEILNVKLNYTEVDVTYSNCGSEISKLVMAGDDVYDIVINDLFPLATLSVSGKFMNVADAPYIDYSKNYWYKGYMEPLSLDGGEHQYILAGDYFIDILRSAHALYFNKNMLASLFDDGDQLYQEVLNNTWTYDKLLSYINESYQDLNGNGKKDVDDRFGMIAFELWGPSIPFIVSADMTYVHPENDGTLTLAMNNERSVKLLEKLNDIFYADGTGSIYTDLNPNSPTADPEATNIFKSGRALFLAYNRLGSFENLRDMKDEVGILPYPKMDETQKEYITSSHDTTEIGVIPVTVSKFDTICAVLEVLCRETQKIVLPAYYETGLKVKYSRDDYSSQMIDIIHDHIGGSFPLAYGDYCSNFFLNGAYYTPMNNKSRDFSSNYAKHEKTIQKKLNKMVESFLEIDQ